MYMYAHYIFYIYTLFVSLCNVLYIYSCVVCVMYISSIHIYHIHIVVHISSCAVDSQYLYRGQSVRMTTDDADMEV